MNEVTFPLGGGEYAQLVRRADPVPTSNEPDVSIVTLYYRRLVR